MTGHRHIVIGTAGHVDHGKTSLVQALTGVDCDRLPEEKARGITIELGFAEWKLREDLTASIVDVPGHEKFVRTMVAGASAIECVLLCVAADDGVMPQTREHLEICKHMGCTAGVVVITKSDLASPDLLSLVREDIAELVKGTFLERASVVACSTREGTGLDELKAAVAKITLGVAPPPGDAKALLAVDRVFSKPGIGTVVTGTLVSGQLNLGDVVEVVGGDSLRVRGLQVHGSARETVSARARVAVAVSGEARRGDVLCSPGTVRATRIVHASISPAIPKRVRARLHLGTDGIDVAVTPIAAGVVRIVAASPFPAFAGQRFVLRQEETIGGGTIEDPHPLARRRAEPWFLGDDRARLLIAESRYAGVHRDDFALRAPHLQPVGIEVEQRFYSDAVFDGAKKTTLEAVQKQHADKPLLAGISPGEIASRHPRVAALVPRAIESLVRDKELLIEDGLVRSAQVKREAETFERILERYRNAGLAPDSEDVVRDALGLDPNLFRQAMTELRRRGELKVIGEHNYAPSALQTLRNALKKHFATHPTLSPVDFKALCNLTRKHAIPLLEWADREGLTKRKGDLRVQGEKA